MLPPVRIALPAELKGRARRAALGRVMQDIMVDAAFRPERLHAQSVRCPAGRSGLYDRGRRWSPISFRTKPAAITPDRADYRRLILGSVVLGRKLAAFTRPGEHVGVMLPNAVGTVVTFFALQSQGRVPAMMNFTAGADGMLSCCVAAGIETILTSRRAVQKGKLDRLVEAVGAGSFRLPGGCARPRSGWRTSCAACWRPAVRSGCRVPGWTPGSPALVLFTSGSEGAPKGVVHSHRALLANCAQLRSVVDFNPTDRVFNALPMFHAFGMIATLLPLMYGVRNFLYPSPLHYRMVPEMVYAEQSTIMFGTDTFLTGYARRGNPLDFQSLRYIFAGRGEGAAGNPGAYMAHFKKPIFEGYGVTETAPVLALSTWAHRPGGFRRPAAAGYRGAAGAGARHR